MDYRKLRNCKIYSHHGICITFACIKLTNIIMKQSKLLTHFYIKFENKEITSHISLAQDLHIENLTTNGHDWSIRAINL